jgi:O-antigen/teichoic acid export membrane protein
VTAEELDDAPHKRGAARRAIGGLRWMGSTQLASQLVTWSLTILTIRALRPYDYGISATVALFTVTAGLLLDGGLSAILVSWHDLDREIQAAAETWVLLLSVALTAFIFLLAPSAGDFFRDRELIDALRVSALQLPLSGFGVVPLALLARRMSFGRIGVCQLISNVLQAVFTLSMAYTGHAYWSLVDGAVFGAGTRAVLLWISVRQRPIVSLHLGALRPLFRNSSHLLGERLLHYIAGDFDTFILARLAGVAVLGPYSLAKTTSHAILDRVAPTINQVTLPSFAAKRGNLPAQIAALQRITSTSAALAFPVFWLMGAISVFALPLVFGPRWQPLVFPFVAFAFILPLRTVYTLLDSAIVGMNATATTFKNMIVWAVIMIPLLSVGAFFGMKTAALAWVSGFPVVFFLASWRIAKRFDLKLLSLVSPLAAPAGAAAVACAIVTSTAHFLLWVLAPAAVLCLELLIGGCSYLAALWLLGRDSFRQAQLVVFQLFGLA